MNRTLRRLTGFACAFVLLLSCFFISGTEQVGAITASKNTQDFINALGGMPSYTASGDILYITIDGVIYGVDAAVLVPAMVQSEIIGPVSGSPDPPNTVYAEAYKAQAIAAHSYVKYQNNQGTAPAWGDISYNRPHAETVKIVQPVINRLLTYNGKVILAAFAASSGLHTQGNQYAWGGAPLPYLQGVACKYDEDIKTYTFTLDEMTQILKTTTVVVSKVEISFNPTGDASTWFKVPTTTKDQNSDIFLSDGGFIVYMRVCGQRIDGDALQDLLGIRSYKAQVSYNASTKKFTVTTRGNGHGLGLSQNSALGYAKNDGWTYEQILKHFYTGVTITGSDDSSSSRKKGDVNGDGKINVDDILKIQDHILGRTLLIGTDLKTADVNGDAKVNVDDILKIQDHILGRNLLS